MSRAHVETDLPRKQRHTVRQHAAVIHQLPRGEFVTSERAGELDTFTFADLSLSTKRTLRCAGILRDVGRVREHDDRLTQTRGRVWVIEDAAHDYAAEVVAETNSPCGCGHSGIRNLGDGEYTCTTDSCDVRVSREVVER